MAQMKIDFDALRKLAAIGATAEMLIAHLELMEQEKEAKRARDRKRQKEIRDGRKATSRDIAPKPSDTERHRATLDDSPRSRLYREGSSALITLGRTERASRGLIAGWLKITHDDDQLVLATILRARDLAVADAAGWVLATLKGKMNGTGHHRRKTVCEAADDLIARAKAAESAAGIGEFDAVTIEGTGSSETADR